MGLTSLTASYGLATHTLYGILSQENEQLLVTGLMYVI